ncbi:uncharacterized protein CEXT_659391 [Caerostris extrusa]|uniref:Uncharacterized protein n=1 Tax=Caerostris extrusa TaxID=172846 RepID=A0AAV4RWD5_CAEEX|nr:uncharacterized protein CEXT_659391 [Caerostris extrusa]
MSGHAHETCGARVHCHHKLPSHCLCGLNSGDLRQKYLDPAQLFVKGRDDNRIVHFVQPKFEKSVSEYREKFAWPNTKHPVVAYTAPKSPYRFEPKSELDKQSRTPKSAPKNPKNGTKV